MRNLGTIKRIVGANLAVVLADETRFTIDSEHISMNGIVLDDATSMDGQFTIGAAVTGQLTITVLNEDELYSSYNFRGATAQLFLIGTEEIPDDDDEEIQERSIVIGWYNIVNYTYDGSSITLTAYDNLCLFDLPCTETRGETVSFPMTLTQLVQKAAQICRVTLASQSAPIPNGSYIVAQKPEGWDTMTWHDVISYCAQLGGVYAKVNNNGQLFFDWYDINAISGGYDGGTFDTADTPYSDGDTLNGGDFSYRTADSADGGTFNYPDNMHFVSSPYALTIDTDDVYITGLKVVLAAADNIDADENTQDYTTALYGTDGYVITISGNPFIQTTAQADSIKNFLGAVVVGMWFRPLTSTIDENLSVEAGDQAFINGVNGHTYQCFISHVTYTTYAGTVITCDAEPNSSNNKTRFTAADKLASHVSGVQKKIDSSIEASMVDHIITEHCLANNRVIPDGQTFADIQYTPWSATMPTFEQGKYYWSRIVVYYKDGSVKYGDPYYDMGAQTTAETVIAVRIAQDAADTADEIAQAAAAIAGEKRRVFNSTPVPPYDVRDMWFDGAHGVVYLCTTAKTDGEAFSTADWTEYSRDVSNHFWYDSSGAHVSETQGDVTTGASQTISSNGTVMMRNGKLITSWTGTQAGDAAINFYDLSSSVARNSDLVASFGRGGITHYVNNIVCQALTPSGLSFYTPDSNHYPEAIFGSSGVNLYANGQLGMALTSGDMRFYDSDGSTEVAVFGSSGATIGKNDSFRAIINQDSIELMDDKGASGFRISLDGNETQRTIQNTYVVHSTQRPNITFSAPISSQTLTFKAVIGNNTYTEAKTSEQLPVNQSFNLGVNSSSGYIRVTRTGTNTFKAVYVDTTSRGSTLQISYTVSFDMAKMNFNGGNNILWQGGHYMSASQSATLSESVSEQLTGIVLVWSAYFEGAPQNYDWFYQFIPKDHVLRSEVGGVSSGMMTSAFQNGTAYLGMKYVLVSNNAIQGHEINGRSSMTVGGATLTNTHWVLRYVLGV